jgi:hypothetical protein
VSYLTRRLAGTVLSEHRTSIGLVRYRWWEGSITVELLVLEEPTAILAVVPGSDRPAAVAPEARGVRHAPATGYSHGQRSSSNGPATPRHTR